jgi:hypothetical protein
MIHAVPEPERYVDARELAARMGVGTTTVKKWAAEGMPSYTWGLRRTRRYLVSECIEWALARESRITPPPGGARTSPGQPKE